MAKKNEFRPDKPRGGLLHRLYLSRQQRRSLLKWSLYVLFLLVLSVLQDVVLCHLQIGGATTDLVPCGIILICLMEGVEQGCVFTLAASLLYLFSGTAPGPYAMVLITVLAIVLSAFRQGYLQKGAPAALLCTAAAMLLYELAIFAIGCFLQLTTPERLPVFLITAGLTLAVAPVLYYLLRFISAIGGETWKE